MKDEGAGIKKLLVMFGALFLQINVADGGDGTLSIFYHVYTYSI